MRIIITIGRKRETTGNGENRVESKIQVYGAFYAWNVRFMIDWLDTYLLLSQYAIDE